jgi:hypothetical protein
MARQQGDHGAKAFTVRTQTTRLKRKLSYALLTRFNVRIMNRSVPNREWMLHRISLFEEFCLPSVANQTDQDFVWLIFIDKDTDPDLLQRIMALKVVRPFELCLTEGGRRRHFIRPAVKQYIPRADYLVSTRLDNDDAIGKYFIADVKACVTGSTRLWINFRCGLVLSDGGLYKATQESNPFLSLIEPFLKFRTAFAKGHNRADSLAPIHEPSARPAWMKIIHGQNICNQVRSDYIPVGPDQVSDLLEDYPTQIKRHVLRIYNLS